MSNDFNGDKSRKKQTEMSLIPCMMANKKKHLNTVLEKHFCTVQQTENNSLFVVCITINNCLPFWSSVFTERIKIDTRTRLSSVPPNQIQPVQMRFFFQHKPTFTVKSKTNQSAQMFQKSIGNCEEAKEFPRQFTERFFGE